MKETQNTGLVFLYRNRKMLLIALLSGAVLGLGITFFIPKKYLATAIIYPYNSHTRDQLAINPQFGFELETEQLMQLLESKEMRERTIKEFKLYDFYGIDTNRATWRSEISLEYLDDVEFMRSKYLSVVINVQMKDPQMAAKVANFQVAEVNNYRASIFQSNRMAELSTVENEYFATEQGIKELKDSIYSLSPDKALLFNFLENLDNENYDPSEFVTTREMEPLVEKYLYEMNRFPSLRARYDEVRKALEAPLPSVYSIDTATATYKKVSPSFMINSLVGALLVFALTVMMRLLLDKWRQLGKENT